MSDVALARQRHAYEDVAQFVIEMFVHDELGISYDAMFVHHHRDHSEILNEAGYRIAVVHRSDVLAWWDRGALSS